MNLPKSTEFRKRIPKEKFYENLDISPTLKESFVNQIKTIYWSNKISEDTVNIKAGEHVNEIQVFRINLKQQSIDEKVLLQIDRQIPYHIIFVLKYGDLCQTVIGYKEESAANNNAFKVSGFYYSDWMAEAELPIEIKGLDLDSVYENVLRTVAGDRLNIDKSEDIADSVKRDEEIQKLEGKIDKLKQKRRKTKQLNKQVKMSDEIRELEKQLESLKM